MWFRKYAPLIDTLISIAFVSVSAVRFFQTESLTWGVLLVMFFVTWRLNMLENIIINHIKEKVGRLERSYWASRPISNDN